MVKTNPLKVDDCAPLLDVRERVFGDEDRLTHALGVYLAVGLPSLRVGCVEHEPSWETRQLVVGSEIQWEPVHQW